MDTSVIAPEEVTVETVRKVFENAFLDTAMTADGKISITEGGIRTFLIVDTDRKFLNFLLIFGCKQGAKVNDIVDFATEVNKGLIFLRAIPLQDGIVFDYWLSYDAGLLPKQIITAYRWLRKATVDAIQKYDQKRLLD